MSESLYSTIKIVYGCPVLLQKLTALSCCDLAPKGFNSGRGKSDLEGMT
jgi:hypothetical protein